MINGSVDMVRGLTWREARDLLRFARRRLTEERLPQVAGSLTFTTTLALVPLLTIALASLALLIVWLRAWETFVAPLPPGGSWLALKAVPLLIRIYGL